jgi:TonB family protein
MSRAGEDRIRSLITWLAIAGFAVLAAVIGAKHFYQGGSPAAQAAPVREPAPVELAVEQVGGVLVVHWSPEISPVLHASHGLLSITDGEYERRIGLTSRDLNVGSMTYVPLSRNVSFQLALYDGPASGKGSVLFLARGGGEELYGSPEPVARELDTLASPPVASPPVIEKSRETRVRRRIEETDSERAPVVAARPLETAAVTPMPAVAEPMHDVTVAPPALPVTPPPAAKVAPAPPPGYRVTVTAEPSRGSRFEQMLGKVPFVKRIAKVPAPSELVKPVRKVEPQIPGVQVTEPVQTSVEIQVDPSGQVKSAKLVDLDRAPGNLEWAVLRAAKAWKFEGPKEGQTSWQVLTFHFEPAKSVRTE